MCLCVNLNLKLLIFKRIWVICFLWLEYLILCKNDNLFLFIMFCFILLSIVFKWFSSNVLLIFLLMVFLVYSGDLLSINLILFKVLWRWLMFLIFIFDFRVWVLIFLVVW